LALAFFALIAISTPAATSTWSGGGGNVNWSTAGNWDTTPTSSTSTDLIFAGTTNTGTIGTPLNQDIAAPMLLNTMTFNSGAAAFFLGGSALRFQAASNTITQSSSNAVSIANAINAPSTNSTFTINLAGNGTGLITLSGVIAAGSGQRDYAVVKSGASTFVLSGNNTYTGGTTINGGTLCINSATSLGATAGGLTINAGTLEISTGFTTTRVYTLGNAASTIQVDASQTLTVSSAIAGTGKLNKTGAGTMVLGGNNTFSGGTDVTAGTLQINASERLANTGTLSVSGGTFDLQTFSETVGAVTLVSGSITGTGAGTLTGSAYTLQSGTVSAILAGSGTVTKNTSGTVTLSGANTFSGALTVADGTLSIGTINNASASGVLGNSANAVVMGGSGTTGTLSYTGSTASSTKTFTMATSGTGVFDVTNSGTTLTLSGLIGGSGNLTKTSAGTLSLSGSNTFSGVLTVAAGNLSIATINDASANGVLGNSTNAVVLGSSGTTGTLQYTGATASSTKKFTMATGGTGAFQIDTAGTTLTLSGIIDGSGALSKTGAGTLSLSGVNTYSGGTTVSAGTLQLSGSGTLGSTSGSLTVNGGTLNLNGTNQGVGNLTGSGGTILNNATGTNATLTVGNSNGTGGNYAGVIADHTSGTGTVALTKTGTGTITLSGINTFTGTTIVNGGTLALAAAPTTSALGSTTSITVNSGGTLLLGGSDQINNSATMALHGGTFAKGNFNEGTAGAAGMGALTLTATGSHIDFGTGTVGVLSFASFSPGANTLTIDNWTGVANTLGSGSTDRLIFNSDQSGNLGSFLFGGYAGAVEFGLVGGYYEVVPLTAVPEPATYIAGLLVLGALGWNQRRRWRRILRKESTV
jgi:autotransporter-associated beta strand protein